MSDTTTTPAGTDGIGDALRGESQPVETDQAQAGAEDTHDETQTDTGAEAMGVEQNEASEEPDADVGWLKNKGIDPLDPEALKKAAQLLRKNDRDFHQQREEAKQTIQQGFASDEQISDMQQTQDPEVAQLRRDMKELMFYSNNPDAKGHEDELIAVGRKYPKLAADFDLDTLWAIAKSQRTDDLVKEAENRARQATKQEIAKSSSVVVPGGKANSGSEPVKKDPILEALRSND